MNPIPDFISELVRAANEIARLSEFERARLLDRAYTIIRDLRHRTRTGPTDFNRDPLVNIMTMSLSVVMFSNDEVKRELLSAAAMIRALKIVLDTQLNDLQEEETE